MLSTTWNPPFFFVFSLHCADDTPRDASVPEHLRGKYGAFGVAGGSGAEHLRQLASSGLTHVHLLPTYDYGSVPERASDQQSADHSALHSLPPVGRRCKLILS